MARCLRSRHARRVFTPPVIPYFAIAAAVAAAIAAAFAFFLLIEERATRRRPVDEPRGRTGEPKATADESERTPPAGEPSHGAELATLPATSHVRTLLATAVALFLIGAALAVADEVLASSAAADGGSTTADDDAARGRDRNGPFAEIRYVDVGQGDAVVMRVGDAFVVNDAGQFNAEGVDAALRQLGARRIDIAILSHPHTDHVANFVPLLETHGWKVDVALLSHSVHWEASPRNRRVLDTLVEHGVPLRYVNTGDEFHWGGASWEVLNPPPDTFTAEGQEANASVVIGLRIGRASFLFAGDIGRSVERQVADRWRAAGFGRAAAFLATHHGSRSGSTDPLLDAIRPRTAIFSTGPNRFDHPREDAIKRLRARQTTLWCTDVNGTVTAAVTARGDVSFRASKQRTPWITRTGTPKGRCVDQQ
jgi:competence protein ComEC